MFLTRCYWQGLDGKGKEKGPIVPKERRESEAVMNIGASQTECETENVFESV